MNSAASAPSSSHFKCENTREQLILAVQSYPCLWNTSIELTLLQENVPLNLLAQKYGLQYQTILNFQPPLPLNGNLRNTST